MRRENWLGVTGVTLFSSLLAASGSLCRAGRARTNIVVGHTGGESKQADRARETMGYCSGVVPLAGQIRARPVASRMPFDAVHQASVDCFATCASLSSNSCKHSVICRCQGKPDL